MDVNRLWLGDYRRILRKLLNLSGKILVTNQESGKTLPPRPQGTGSDTLENKFDFGPKWLRNWRLHSKFRRSPRGIGLRYVTLAEESGRKPPLCCGSSRSVLVATHSGA